MSKRGQTRLDLEQNQPTTPVRKVTKFGLWIISEMVAAQIHNGTGVLISRLAKQTYVDVCPSY